MAWAQQSLGCTELRVFREITHPKAGQLCVNSVGHCGRNGTAGASYLDISLAQPLWTSQEEGNTIQRESN